MAVCLAAVVVGVGDAGAGLSPQQDAEQRYNDAELAFADGDARAALDMFDALVVDFPRSRYPSTPWRAAAGVRAGEIELNLGRLDAAAARFVSVVDIEETTAWTSRARLGLATSLLLRREWPAAAQLLQRVVDDFNAGSPGGDPLSGTIAVQRLTLLHRVWLRAAGGGQPWQRASGFDVGVPLQRPTGVAPGANGVLVSDDGADTMIFRDAVGTAATFTVPNVQRPSWSARGTAYVAAEASVVAPLSAASFRFSYTDGSRQRAVEDIRAVVRTPTGSWFLLNGSRSVMMFDAAGAFVRTLDLRDGEPVDIEVGPRGRLYVIEKSRREVMVFDNEGALRSGFNIDTWREPYALAIDAIGHVYVLDRGNKKIDVFDPEGGILWSLGPVLPGGVELNDPRDIAVDGSGRIFIADRRLTTLVVIE